MGRHFIEAAKKGMCQHHINVAAVVVLPFEGLEWFDDYDEAADWAQEYAIPTGEKRCG